LKITARHIVELEFLKINNFHELSRANGTDGHLRESGAQDQTMHQRQRRGII
jgi:hypothetical protein